MSDELKVFKLYENGKILTSDIFTGLIGFALHQDCHERAIELIKSAAARLYTQAKIINFLVIGLVVTNGFWFANWMGWV